MIRALGMMLMLMLVQGVACFAADSVWTPTHYRQHVSELRAAIDAGDTERVTTLAQRIAEAHISWPQGPTAGDPTLVGLAKRQALPALRQRVAAIERELVELAESPVALVIDRAALARLSEREANAGNGLKSGGSVTGNPLNPEHLPRSISERLLAAAEWSGEQLKDFIEWIRTFFNRRSKGESDSGSGVVTLTLIVVGAVVLIAGVLAVLAWRRREPAVQPSSTPVLAERVDADPRTRAVDEWARYARELSGLGRHREAIRAWYHALLVGCWSHGLLHHRMGRTNWEYALALSAMLPWRGRFRDLTQRFDQAWYGGRVDADEAQAFASEAEEVLGQLRSASASASAA